MRFANNIFKGTLLSVVSAIAITYLLSCNTGSVVDMDSQSFPSISSSTSISLPEGFVSLDRTEDYSSILGEYREYVNLIVNTGSESDEGLSNAISNKVFSAPYVDGDLAYHWYCMLIETNVWSYRAFPKSQAAFGYALYDLNGNGTPELILLLEDYTVLAIYSLVDNKPQLLDAYWPRHKCAITETGTLYTSSSGGATYWNNCIWQVSQDGKSLILIEEFGLEGHENWYIIVDGERKAVSSSEIAEMQEKYPVLSAEAATEITKNSGLEFIPLFS